MSIPINFLIQLCMGRSWLMMEGPYCGTLNAAHTVATRLDAHICNEGGRAHTVKWMASIGLVLQTTHTVGTALQVSLRTFGDGL